MKIIIPFAILIIVCSGYRMTKRTDHLIHGHGWQFYYNDSLIYSTDPTIKNKSWTTKRWDVHELRLKLNELDSSDNIRINYQTDVIRHYYGNILVKNEIDTLLLSVENSSQLQLIELKPFLKDNSTFELWFRQTHKLKNNIPDYSQTTPYQIVRIKFDD